MIFHRVSLLTRSSYALQGSILKRKPSGIAANTMNPFDLIALVVCVPANLGVELKRGGGFDVQLLCRLTETRRCFH